VAFLLVEPTTLIGLFRKRRSPVQAMAVFSGIVVPPSCNTWREAGGDRRRSIRGICRASTTRRIDRGEVALVSLNILAPSF
jgi:hypothetical protein